MGHSPEVGLDLLAGLRAHIVVSVMDLVWKHARLPNDLGAAFVLVFLEDCWDDARGDGIASLEFSRILILSCLIFVV